MSLQYCPLLSTSARNNGLQGTQAASEFLAQIQHDRKISRSQLLDGGQLQQISQTLNRPNNLHSDKIFAVQDQPDGTLLPAGYHLAYFTPSALNSSLGSDGSDRNVNPRASFTRRMWAVGEMTWTRGNPLKVGDRMT
ncbi:uncharacterized protein BP5553_06622 [Venustampulla echinocandica]|uniref:Uncharacterized protein n=1 Tax=Venustampulla echinocandica TaxID=2656787 RepID=A0A370TKG1_9HELO|nr:uncharacterized protein BP5553_06622 [Venustampulla echinocandica]RDL36010.1 hypothetical protein BP5553_06622 [Venustampulla echinocandica]